MYGVDVFYLQPFKLLQQILSSMKYLNIIIFFFFFLSKLEIIINNNFFVWFNRETGKDLVINIVPIQEITMPDKCKNANNIMIALLPTLNITFQFIIILNIKIIFTLFLGLWIIFLKS